MSTRILPWTAIVQPLSHRYADLDTCANTQLRYDLNTSAEEGGPLTDAEEAPAAALGPRLARLNVEPPSIVFHLHSDPVFLKVDADKDVVCFRVSSDVGAQMRNCRVSVPPARG